MKTILLLLAIAVCQTANADELIQMSNGMTCWRTESGFVYGCSGGASVGDSGFNDVRTGTRYEIIDNGTAINTRNGQPIHFPQQNRNNEENQWKINPKNQRDREDDLYYRSFPYPKLK